MNNVTFFDKSTFNMNFLISEILLLTEAINNVDSFQLPLCVNVYPEISLLNKQNLKGRYITLMLQKLTLMLHV